MFHPCHPFFVQDDPNANPTLIGPLPDRFGLSLPSWDVFRDKLNQLNTESPHKLFFFARHGQGHHNVAEAKYGTRAWDDHWSKLEGDEEFTWGPDPDLTHLGETQAKEAAAHWKTELAQGAPLPQVFYSSPMTRAIRTFQITFEHIPLPTQALILEDCREEYGQHTCDKRRTRSYLVETYKDLLVDENMSEEDELWLADQRESKDHMASRAHRVLERVFDTNKNEQVISITAHSGIINGFLQAIGRPRYDLPTGGILPVLICQSK